MAEGSKEYGCFISMEKTLINFKYGGVKQVVGNGKLESISRSKYIILKLMFMKSFKSFHGVVI
jgi:hypothetical protein